MLVMFSVHWVNWNMAGGKKFTSGGSYMVLLSSLCARSQEILSARPFASRAFVLESVRVRNTVPFSAKWRTIR